MISAFHYDLYVWYGMPEHLDARTTISRDIFYCISANQNFQVKNLPPDHKISEKCCLYKEINQKKQNWQRLGVVYIRYWNDLSFQNKFIPSP